MCRTWGLNLTSSGEAFINPAATLYPFSYFSVEDLEVAYVAPSWTFVLEKYDTILFMYTSDSDFLDLLNVN